MNELRYERRVVKLRDIKLDGDNPNRMTPIQEDALDNSLSRFGYIYEIVVDKNTMLLADGEHRLKKLLSQGFEEAEVVLFDFKDDAERRLFRQVANKVRGTHDVQLDAREYKGLLEHFDKASLSFQLGQETLEIDALVGLLDIPPRDKKVEFEAKQHKCPACGHVW